MLFKKTSSLQANMLVPAGRTSVASDEVHLKFQ